MTGRPWASVVLLLGLSIPALGAEFILSWQFERDVVVDSFLLSYHTATNGVSTLQQFRVPWSAEPTCGVLGDDVPADLVCARPPGCLPPGLYRFVVQAERGTETSDASNASVCEALANCTYNCQQFEDVNTALREGMDALPPVAPVAPPDPAPLQALADQLEALERGIPREPATPVVATPPT